MNIEELAGDEAAAARVLSGLAESVEIGSAPYDRLIAGGRRRLRRRRVLSTGAAAVLVAAAVGGVAVFGGLGQKGPGVSDVAAAPSAVATSEPAAAVTVSATPTAPARDPFTPVRTVVGHGTANGRQWQAWAALWPATATKEDAYRQAELIWEDRHAAIPQLPKTTRADIDRGWNPHVDTVNLYLTVDGQRQVDDTVHQTDVPGGPDTGAGSSSPTSGGGAMLGFKGAEMGASPVVIEGVRPGVAKIAVTWNTGGTSEAVPVTVGDSPTRWYAVAKKPGAQPDTYTYLGADGTALGTNTGWFRSF
ncbi:hypothetical protein [Kitasatospora aureofaciens]|uniref:hypothetical protein n=1 Tax=Kitasatospora aureofaciens TaxID=1894 RepID=UPI001C44F7C8|nr:hypothetical protein [Kitasatospora aureofaciens]MBV6700579.1 hypothetical protein [Kitasatospora aureofaciens]